MKVVCHELAQASIDPEGSSMDELTRDADRLVLCLATKVIAVLFQASHIWISFAHFVIFLFNVFSVQVAKTFDYSLTGASSRSCKYVLNTLMQVLTSQFSLGF